MNYDNLIKNWHIKASEEDYFSRFVFEYLAFIALLCKKKYTNHRTDRNVIQRLKQDNKTKQSYLTKISSEERLKKHGITSWQNSMNSGLPMQAEVMMKLKK
jgi:hypothetical protein